MFQRNASEVDYQYEDLLRKIYVYGTPKEDRTGTGTFSIFGADLRYDLSDGTLPLITTKKLHIKSVFTELIWFLSGNTNTKFLKENGVRIWDEWADENGELGPVYGNQWRNWRANDGKVIDQIAVLQNKLRTFPEDRGMLVSAWNVGDLDKMALRPCHHSFEVYTHTNESGKRVLSMKVNQRSADIFLGVPFNISSYAALVHMLAATVNMEPGELWWTGTDVHLYSNHRFAASTQLIREAYAFPKLRVQRKENLWDYTLEDLEVVGYQFHPHIPGKVAV